MGIGLKLILWYFGWSLLAFVLLNLWYTGSCNCKRYKGHTTPRSKICCVQWFAFGILLVWVLW
ncbi:MAG: hypothetical protein QM487_09620 [Candidatus Marithrix sp.]